MEKHVVGLAAGEAQAVVKNDVRSRADSETGVRFARKENDELIDKYDKTRSVMKLCRDLFGTTNLIASDFDDVQLFRVSGRDFPQQPGGTGLHITFSVSWHAIGKTGKDAHEALAELLPDEEDQL